MSATPIFRCDDDPNFDRVFASLARKRTASARVVRHVDDVKICDYSVDDKEVLADTLEPAMMMAAMVTGVLDAADGGWSRCVLHLQLTHPIAEELSDERRLVIQKRLDDAIRRLGLTKSRETYTSTAARLPTPFRAWCTSAGSPTRLLPPESTVPTRPSIPVLLLPQ